AWIAVLDPRTQEGRVVASHGADARYVEMIRVTAREGSLGWDRPASRAIRSRTPVVLNDLRTEPSLARLLDEAGVSGLRAEACFPIVVAGRSVGVLTLLAGETGVFDEEEVKLLEELVGDIAFALDHLAKEERLNYLAYYDALTGLANSALVHERLA